MSHVADRWFRKVEQPDGKTVSERTTRHGKGMRYRARYIDPEGRERSQSFPDGRKKEAADWAADQESAVRKGIWTDPDSGRTTLRRFTADVFLPAMSTNITTQERVRGQLAKHVLPALGGKPLGYLAAHPSVIQAWLNGLKVAPSTAKVIMDTLSAVLSMAYTDGLISRNPCRGGSVKRPPRPDRLIVPWTTARVAAIRAAMTPRYRATVDAGAGLGLRHSEMFGFSPDDVNWLRGTVHVCRQVKVAGGKQCFAPPKGGRDRELPLASVTQEALSVHVRDFPPVPVTLPWGDPEGKPATVSLMFTTEHGRALRRSDYDRYHWARAIAAAGIEKDRRNGYHALRHRFASRALAAGADIRKLAAWLGHHDPGFTLRQYCHMIPEQDARMRQQLDAALRDEDDGPTTARGSGTGAP